MLLTPEHQPQSRISRIPRTRRVRTTSARKIPVPAFSPFASFKHVERKIPAVRVAARLRAVECAPNPPSLEELEIECILPDFAIDDPSRRIALPAVRVRNFEITPLTTEDGRVFRPVETDRPTPLARLMIRLHPKHFDSGDDTAIG